VCETEREGREIRVAEYGASACCCFNYLMRMKGSKLPVMKAVREILYGNIQFSAVIFAVLM
jgi:hypothetical protein